MNKFNANIQHNNYLGTLEIIKIILSTWIACYIHIRITTYISVLIIFFVIFLLNLIVLKKSTNKVHFSHEIESSFFGVVQRFFFVSAVIENRLCKFDKCGDRYQW